MDLQVGGMSHMNQSTNNGSQQRTTEQEAQLRDNQAGSLRRDSSSQGGGNNQQLLGRLNNYGYESEYKHDGRECSEKPAHEPVGFVGQH
jgi:hypothetical protein